MKCSEVDVDTNMFSAVRHVVDHQHDTDHESGNTRV